MEVPKPAAPPAPPPRLVILDDEPLNARAYRRLFEGAIEVLDAVEFQEGLSLLAREPAAVVLLEVSLPGPGGVSLAQHLEQHQPEISRRMIVTSAGLSVQTAFRFQFLHGCSFLPKPIDPDLLKREVLRLHPIALAGAAAHIAPAAPAIPPPAA
jgi:DNA-binding NtrC family response regulator